MLVIFNRSMRFFQIIGLNIALLTLVSCGSDYSARESTGTSEKPVAQDLAPDSMPSVTKDTLATKDNGVSKSNSPKSSPNIMAGQAEMLFIKANEWSKISGRIAPAIKMYQDILIKYPSTVEASKSTEELMNIYKNKGLPLTSNIVCASSKTLKIQNPCSITLAPNIILSQLYKNQLNPKSKQVNVQMAKELIESVRLFSVFFPEHPETSKHLMHAAEAARNIQDFKTGVDFYNLIVKVYPKSKESEQALFILGFSYDNDLRDVEKARVTYRKFLALYPNSDYAKDIEFSLENLGKTNTEIIQDFEKGKKEL
jgi:tetratricopeptide (TPR) repeat protein